MAKISITMQKLFFIGNIGKDAEVKDLNNGNSVINFSVAVTEKYKDNETTQWFKCAYFKNDTRIAQYLTKGTKVYIEGKPDVEAYVNKNNETVGVLKCIVFQIKLLSSNNVTPSNSNESSGNNYSDTGDDSDLPF